MKTRKKFLGYCENCKKSLCEEHAYFYVDGDNIAITNNSPYLCKSCYENKYNKKIESEVEVFRNVLINNLLRLKRINNTETIKIDKLINYIKGGNYSE